MASAETARDVEGDYINFILNLKRMLFIAAPGVTATIAHENSGSKNQGYIIF